MDALDQKLLEHFDGKVVRKDLLHRIKKGTNVPTFVLEFLLARYCASDEPAEIQAGLEAVLATLQDNYVRPDESNAAQSKVATKGRHRFIDKVHVRYIEKERRHWAALENFNSQRIAVPERFYRDNDRAAGGRHLGGDHPCLQRGRRGRLCLLHRRPAADPTEPLQLRGLPGGTPCLHTRRVAGHACCAPSGWSRAKSAIG
jgi:hypothetical protein